MFYRVNVTVLLINQINALRWQPRSKHTNSLVTKLHPSNKPNYFSWFHQEFRIDNLTLQDYNHLLTVVKRITCIGFKKGFWLCEYFRASTFPPRAGFTHLLFPVSGLLLFLPTSLTASLCLQCDNQQMSDWHLFSSLSRQKGGWKKIEANQLNMTWSSSSTKTEWTFAVQRGARCYTTCLARM